jgi:phosphoglycerate dehydrogenase-like enzyme
MQKYKVVYLEPVPKDVEAVVRSRLPPEFNLQIRMDTESVEEVIQDADFILVATTPLPKKDIQAAQRLRLIQHQGVGYDKTDVTAAGKRGISVALCPEGTIIGVAEHVFLLILALYKKICKADASLRAGDWLQWELRPSSYEIAGKTLGILGLGHIGKEVAKRAKAFDAKIIYYDHLRQEPEIENKLGASFVPSDILLSDSDILSLHIPLTPDTYHIIGEAELNIMKETSILINTARGPLVDEQALVEALQSQRIAGAGLDVFENEPLPQDSALINLPNVVITPHISAGTVDALITKMDACFANMLRIVHGDIPIHVISE